MRKIHMFGAAALLAGLLARAASDTRRSGSSRKLSPRSTATSYTRGELKGAEPDALREKIDQLLLINRAKELDIKVDAEIARFIARVQASSNIADPDGIFISGCMKRPA